MKTEVAIVGGGPVGLGLAIELGQRGIGSVVLEKTTDLHRIPKGQNLTQRTMEHFRVWGVAEAVRAERLMPADYPAVGINAYGSLASGHAHPWFKRSRVDPYYFASNERLPQYLTESVLRSRVAELDAVTVRYGTRAVSLKGSDATVVTTDRDENVEAEYVVGCDGSHSMVREAVGITETKSDYDRKMVLMVFRSTELHDLLEDRFGPAAFFNILDPGLDGYWRFLGRVDVGESWFFHAPVDPDSTPDSLDHENLLRESVGADFPLHLDYIGFWDLRIAVADTYRKDRVFIAGDAAHSHPPYGGYGINTGLEDVRNLGWKLAATLRGWGGEGLLDSYTTERRPVFASTASDFIEKFIDDDREFISRHDPRADEAGFARAWERRRRRAAGAGVSEFEPHYEGSPLVFGPDAGRSSAVGAHSHTPRAGHHLPPPETGADLLDDLGSGFAFIPGPGMGGVELEAAARRLGIPLHVLEEDHYGRAMLVRPDHYATWVDNGSDIDAVTMLRRGTGHHHAVIGGYHHHYRRLGEDFDGSPLVFLHEGLGSVELWRGFPAAVVAGTRRPGIVYSRRGNGWSQPLTSARQPDYMHKEALDTLPQVIDRLIGRAGILIGHSDGASIALIYAGAGHPVEGLVLIAPHVFAEEEGLESIRAIRADFGESDMSERMAKYHIDPEATFYGWADIWLSPEFRSWNLEEYLSGVQCPTLVVQGTDDEYGTLRQVDAIAHGIEGPVETVVVDHAGHSPHLSHPDLVRGTVVEFIRELE